MDGSCMDEQQWELARAWLIKAKRDLAAAAALGSGVDDLLDSAMYHASKQEKRL